MSAGAHAGTTTAPRTLAPRPAPIRDTVVMASRSLRLTLRAPTTLFVSSVFPILLMLTTSVSFARIVMPDASYADYIDYSLPLFVAMGITFGTLPTAVAVHVDRVSGFDDRLRTLPMSPVAPLAGRIVADGVRNLSTVVVLVCVGSLLGFRFTTGVAGILGFFLVPLVYGFGMAWPMVAVAMHARSAEAVSAAANAVMLTLAFLSTGFVGLDDLPTWAQPIARANPISHLIEAMRAFAHGSPPLRTPLLATGAWSLGLTAVFGALAVRGSTRRR